MGEHFDLPIFCCIIYMWKKKIRCLWYLNKIFQRTDWDVLLVENKDRLIRFGFNFIKTLLEQQGKKIIVINKIFICSMKLFSFYIWFLALMLV